MFFKDIIKKAYTKKKKQQQINKKTKTKTKTKIKKKKKQKNNPKEFGILAIKPKPFLST